MYIARILYPVRVLGPGDRIGIWFNGCQHHCPGCSNPELWEPQDRYNVSFDILMSLINQICQTHHVDGFTLTGGDPFMQPEALSQVLPVLSEISTDILVYTGYQYDTLSEMYPDLFPHIGVLIDGEYIESRNSGAPLRGSDNQNIIILKEQLRDKYQQYLDCFRNEVQNFTTLDGVISVGIHRPGYDVQVDTLLKQKGLENI